MIGRLTRILQGIPSETNENDDESVKLEWWTKSRFESHGTACPMYPCHLRYGFARVSDQSIHNCHRSEVGRVLSGFSRPDYAAYREGKHRIPNSESRSLRTL